MKSYSFCPICAEKLDTAMIDGRERMFCPSCRFVHYVNPLPVAVAVALEPHDLVEVLCVGRLGT